MNEVLPAGENSAKQDGCVDGRNFGIPQPFAGVYVGKVIEESPVVGQFLPQEAQGVQNARFGLSMRHIPALFSDTNSGQPETRSGNTAKFACDGIAGVTPVHYDAGFRMGLPPKILEACLLQFFQKHFVAVGERRPCRRPWRRPRLLTPQSEISRSA